MQIIAAAASFTAVGATVDGVNTARAIATGDPVAIASAVVDVATKKIDAVSDVARTITRYMGRDEADLARRAGEIPNRGADNVPRPTHVTTDPPLNSASEAAKRYELDLTPTHRATVPADRVNDLGPAPDGRATTSGGGSQNATNQPVPVKPCEIHELGC